MHITDIRIEYLKNPMGLDTRTPEISWKLASDRQGDRQTAYHLVVSTQDRLKVVLDTGKVASGENRLRATGTEAWESHTRYLVELVAYDAEGTMSAPGTATFSIGFLDAFGDHAQWITQPDPNRFSQVVLWVTGGLDGSKVNDAKGLCHGIYLRKGFQVVKEIREATLYVCGLGFNHTYLNGNKLGTAVLDPAQTDYHQGALYSTYDATALLHQGFNTWMLVLGNGRHIKAYGYDPTPRGIGLLHIVHTDGSESLVRTDESWLSCSGPIQENSIYEGETYDARKAHTGWEFEKFDTSSWKPAVKTEGYSLHAQTLPPVTVTETRTPVSMNRTSKGDWIIDFGQNMSALLEVVVRGAESGRKLSLKFSELLDTEGNLLTATSREANTEDRYICAGTESETWLPSFTYHGFRFAQLSNYPGEPQIGDIRALVVHTALERVGQFTCSDPLLNRIHDMVQWSQRANVMGIPTDCPQREERMGWLGDVQLVSEQAMYNYDMAAFYRKFLRDIKVSQTPEGTLSDVTPAYWSLYPADPAWGSAYPTLLWAMYSQYGAIAVLEDHFAGVRAYVDDLFGRTKEGVLRDFGKYGDWCPPASTFPKQTPIDVTSTWHLYKDTLTVRDICKVLGKDAEYRLYAARTESLRESFNKAFNNQGQYATTRMSPIDKSAGMTSQTLPLALGMVPAADREKAAKLLIDVIQRRFDYHVDTGIVGTRYLFDVLDALGRSDIALKIISQRTYPSWGYMLEMGATTVWERWEYLAGMGMNSHNHVMFGSVDAWFYKTLCGLSPLDSRWTSILARPYIPASLSSASASVDTPHGPVVLAWHKDTQDIVMEVQVPVGARLTLRLDRCPACLSATLTPLGASSSTPIGQGGETLLEHGSYTVTLKLPTQA